MGNATVVSVEHNVSDIVPGAKESLCEYIFIPPLRPPTAAQWQDCSLEAAGVL